MGMDCRIITKSFKNEIDILKNLCQVKANCNDEKRARQVLSTMNVDFHSVDIVVNKVEDFPMDDLSNYAFYDINNRLVAYFDVKEQRLYL
jgi:hypothetical protein